MSGLQELAAIIGVAEAAFRSISAFYSFMKDLQNAPREIAALRDETISLHQTLYTLLKAVASASIEIKAIALDIGLPHAVGRCSRACAQLHSNLERWTHHGLLSWTSRFRFRRHRQDIRSVFLEINAAKQTTILAVVVTQLSVQLMAPASEKEKVIAYEEAKAKMEQIRVSGMVVRGRDHRYASESEYRWTGASSADAGSSHANISASCKAAEKAADILQNGDIKFDNNKSEGKENMIGIEQKGGTGSSKVHMTNNYTKGDGNKIGIFESNS